MLRIGGASLPSDENSIRPPSCEVATFAAAAAAVVLSVLDCLEEEADCSSFAMAFSTSALIQLLLLALSKKEDPINALLAAFLSGVLNKSENLAAADS